DRAYKMAIRLAGETTEILNNQGYSYMLRGELGAARRKFEKALQREPNNTTILNNLQLMNGSYGMIQRNPGSVDYRGCPAAEGYRIRDFCRLSHCLFAITESCVRR